MRGAGVTQAARFRYRTLGDRIPRQHPLRTRRVVVDALLARMDAELNALSAHTGRGFVPPERRLRARLLNETLARPFFAKVPTLAEWQGVVSAGTSRWTAP